MKNKIKILFSLLDLPPICAAAAAGSPMKARQILHMQGLLDGLVGGDLEPDEATREVERILHLDTPDMEAEVGRLKNALASSKEAMKKEQLGVEKFLDDCAKKNAQPEKEKEGFSHLWRGEWKDHGKLY